MNIRTIVFLILINVLSNGTVHGQFKLDEFLNSARQDATLEPTKAKLDFLQNNNFNGPWISRVEFRTRSNDANISQEDFRFRLTPANPAELKAWKRYYHNQMDLLNTEYKEMLNEALKLRYELAIDHMFESYKKEALESQLVKNRQIIELINSGNAAYELNLGDLIDAQSDELDISLDIQSAQIKLDEIDFYIKDLYNFSGTIDWSQAGLMKVEDILIFFDELKSNSSGRHISLIKIEQKHTLASERFNIEKSESLRNIGYFQAEYDTDRGNEPYRHFGYQIGLRIPIVNPDKPDLNRRKLETMGFAAELNAREDIYRRRIRLSETLMDRYAKQHHDISEKLSFATAQNLLQFQRQDKSIDIADLIKLNEFQMELIIKRNAIEKAIFKNYLEYLDLCGLITESPLKNYLSKNLTGF